MKYKSLSLIFLLLGCFTAIGQDDVTNLRAFQDYEKCAIGLIDAQGDTIRPAIYSKCEYTHRGAFYYWYLQIGDRKGAMDDQGNEFVPVEYTGYYFNSDSLILTHLGNLVGLMI